jgi:tRNA U34 5-methylaminomethyl-2-thiouridine-forming methyltransferase MnmC
MASPKAPAPRIVTSAIANCRPFAHCPAHSFPFLGDQMPTDQTGPHAKAATAENEGEALEWRDGIIPVSRRFDDPYFSLDDGLEETRHVFLGGNDLPARFAPGFHIAELGFGTGLGALVALMAWREWAGKAGVEAPLRFTSFEAYPMSARDMEAALCAFPQARAIADPLIAAWGQGAREIALPGMELLIIEADARAALPAWDGRADAWFLDGFSPAKNPELWGEELLQAVGDHTAQGGSFATYTAAGHVRRALANAGFEVQRIKGFGRKRHMSVGRKA